MHPHRQRFLKSDWLQLMLDFEMEWTGREVPLSRCDKMARSLDGWSELIRDEYGDKWLQYTFPDGSAITFAV